jgi:hypothetical protein
MFSADDIRQWKYITRVTTLLCSYNRKGIDIGAQRSFSRDIEDPFFYCSLSGEKLRGVKFVD